MKRTKIVCTIGPASGKPAVLVKMMKAGMNVCRLNFSHGTHPDHAKLVRMIRSSARKAKMPIAILQDLSGPKIRVGDMPEGGLKLTKGKIVVLSCDAKPRKDTIEVQYKSLYKDVKKGDQILLDDGIMELKVEKIKGKEISAKVVVGGKLKSHKGLNAPTAKLSVSTITPKDKKDLKFGLAQGVDIVSLSFVRSAKDIKQLRSLIKKWLPKGKRFPLVCAKVEMRGAIDDFDSILELVDIIMVARGDLALETEAAKVPVLQKTITQKAIDANRAVIVATEMLASMTERPRPTRAEISDVANAVIDHTDATMLSGESATGKYPVRTVATMASIISETEGSVFDDFSPSALDLIAKGHHKEVSGIASLIARTTDVSALLLTRAAAHFAPMVRRFRPELPIVVSAENKEHAQQLNMYWGIVPEVFPAKSEHAGMMKYIKSHKLARRGAQVVVFDVVDGHVEMREEIA